MKIWKISQKHNFDWDTYDSAIVAAKTEEEARRIHPGGLNVSLRSWCAPEYVTVEYVGTSNRKFPSPVICASFNAG